MDLEEEGVCQGPANPRKEFSGGHLFGKQHWSTGVAQYPNPRLLMNELKNNLIGHWFRPAGDELWPLADSWPWHLIRGLGPSPCPIYLECPGRAVRGGAFTGARGMLPRDTATEKRVWLRGEVDSSLLIKHWTHSKNRFRWGHNWGPFQHNNKYKTYQSS